MIKTFPPETMCDLSEGSDKHIEGEMGLDV